MSTGTLPDFNPQDPLGLDCSLSDDEVAVRDTVRQFCAEHVIPHVAEWFEIGDLPVRDLAKHFGQLGLLGMHLEGYGCARGGRVPSCSPRSRASSRWSRCKGRWPCSRSGGSAPKNRSNSGCPAWPPAN